MKIVELYNVSKEFADRDVIKSVSLSLEQGKIYGLIGRNGSGKSVLLKCISGLMHPTKGDIVVMGKRIGKDIDFAPYTGIAIEQPGLMLNRSAYGNLKLLVSLTRKASPDEINKTLLSVGLDPADKRAVRRYSMGMKQRLSIAMAIIDCPKLLLLDEPLSNLDDKGAYEMRILFRKIADEGKTLIIATHMKADIDELCDIVFSIKDGEIHELVSRTME